jgi:hypothetical protein
MFKKLAKIVSITFLLIYCSPLTGHAYYATFYDYYEKSKYIDNVNDYYSITNSEADYYLKNAMPTIYNTQPNYSLSYGSQGYTTSTTLELKESTIEQGMITQASSLTNQSWWSIYGIGIFVGVMASVIHMGIEDVQTWVKDVISSNTVANGWVDYVPFSHDDAWGYKSGGEWVKNEWLLYNGEFYYIMPSKVMFDARYDDDGWSLAPSSKGSSKIRWFEFEEGGELKLHAEGWEYRGGGNWFYYLKNNTGIATDEPVDINGERFWFDTNGYCSAGRGC